MRVLLAAILVFAFAAPVTAAELVAIRVGDHPTFTRVVFEFDVAGGYRIERNAAGEAANVVRVTLDAASDGRTIESRSPGVSAVSVEAGSPRSVARIDMREPSWPIKEMILIDPPRVVLDFLRPQPAAAAKRAAAAPNAVDHRDDSPPPVMIAAPVVEKEAPAQAAAAIPEPTPIPDESETAAEVFAAEAADASSSGKPEVAVVTEAELAGSPSEEGAPVEPDSDAEDYADATASESDPDLAADRSIPDPVRTERSKAEDSPSAPSEPFSFGTVGAIGAALLVLLGVAFLVMRRRGASRDDDIDVTTMFPGAGAADDLPVPKEGFSMEAPLQVMPAATDERDEVDPVAPVSVASSAISTRRPSTPTNSPGAAPGIFDDALEEKEAMTMDNTDLTIGSDASEASTQLGMGASMEGAGGSNIVRIIQDMESRIAHLEARLDESVDARQQLERQVSAQTEELRVQRAAIARTQRALRGLNRADEEQATEPALRNPDRAPVSE